MWNRNLSTAGFICLFCNKECHSNDSFKHINIETKVEDTFHMKCFRAAVDNLIAETKKKPNEYKK